MAEYVYLTIQRNLFITTNEYSNMYSCSKPQANIIYDHGSKNYYIKLALNGKYIFLKIFLHTKFKISLTKLNIIL